MKNNTDELTITSKVKVYPGDPYPLGATWDGHGVNFAICSECADGIELCLFDEATDEKESRRIRLTESGLGESFGSRATEP